MVIGIGQTTLAVYVAFWLVLPFRKKKNYVSITLRLFKPRCDRRTLVIIFGGHFVLDEIGSDIFEIKKKPSSFIRMQKFLLA